MKLRLIAAAAAIMATGAAQALTPAQVDSARSAGTLKEIYLAGASAQRLFIGAYLQEQCNASSFDVYFDGTGATPAGSNYRAYACNLAKKVGNYAVGTPILVVKRDAGGSFEGVNPIALATTQTTMLVDGSCTATGNPSPTPDILKPSFACANTTTKLSDAGFSDVEPALFQKPANLPDPQAPLTTTQLGNLDIKTVNQTIFGVIVNKKAYRALQEAQGLINPGDPLNEDPAKTPSVTATWVAAVFSGQAEGGANARGWNVPMNDVASVDGDDPANKQVNVCRRTVGSGTQATSNTLFLNNPGAGAAVGYLPFGQTLNAAKTASIGANVGTIQATGTKAVNLGSSTSLVETCVGTTVENAAGFAYGVGYISRENTPTPTGTTTDKGYRFVRLDGTGAIRDQAKIGNYPAVFNATMQWNKSTLTNADKLAFVKAVRTNAGTATSLNGADVDTQNGVMSPPATYTGTYANLLATGTPVQIKFSSRVDRLNNNSVTTLRVVK